MKKNKNEKLKECTLYVDGMHCASCEVLIEKNLLKHKGVESVDASTKDGKVKVFYEEEKPNLESLNSEFKTLGYKFSDKKFKETKKESLFSYKNGELKLNSARLKDSIKISLIVVGLILLFFALVDSGLASRISITTELNMPAYFAFGLFAGASTCAALVGGVLLSMSKQWNEVYLTSESKKKRLLPHALFHFGRIVSFTLVGGIIALVGASLTNFIQDSAIFITILIAILMFIMGAQMLEWNWSKKFSIKLPKFIGRFAADEENFKGKYMPFTIGFLSFLIPCGLTLTAFVNALQSGSFINGSLNMLSFALGTFIFLGVISLVAIGFTQKPIMTANFNKIAGILIIFFALYTFNSQIANINSRYQKNLPTFNDVAEIFQEEKTTDIAQVSAQGTQVINMAVSSSFKPSRFEVKVGVPVEWVIDGTKASGCTAKLIGKGLFDGEVDIAGKTKTIKFTPQKTGTYHFSCWMGMVSGEIEVV